MQVQAFRVSEVLRGHTAIAAVVGQDAGGRTLRLEVPAAEAAAIGSGDVLVIGWTRVDVPPAVMAGAMATPSAPPSAAMEVGAGAGRLDAIDGQAAIVDAVFTGSSAASATAPPAASRTSQVGEAAGAALESLARSAESEFRRLFGAR